MTSYDDWKTDPDYGLSHRDLREIELRQERDDLDEEVRELKEKIELLQAKLDNRDSLLEEILEYCQDNYDVDPDPSGGHHDVPNWFMKTGTEIEDVLGRGGRHGF